MNPNLDRLLAECDEIERRDDVYGMTNKLYGMYCVRLPKLARIVRVLRAACSEEHDAKWTASTAERPICRALAEAERIAGEDG